MSNVIIFTPKHKMDLQRNYDEFIAFCKNQLTLFAEHTFNGKVGWDCDKWSWNAPRGKKLTFVFGISESHSKYTPYQSTFADFAKAYVRYQQSLNAKNSVNWASSLQYLYKALDEQSSENGTTINLMTLNITYTTRSIKL